MKGQQQTGVWVFVAVVLALIVGILAYFTLIGPEFDRASTAREDAQFTREENELLELQIAQMQALEQEVPDWREQIAKISLDMPARIEQSQLERLFAERLEGVGLPLVSMTTGRPELVDPLAAAGFEPPTVEPVSAPIVTPSPEPTAEDGTDDLDTDGASGGTVGGTTTEPAAPEAPFTGLLAMPVTITTEGDPFRVLSFLKDMENQLTRFYTVTTLSVAKASPSEETPGRPALEEDQWVVQITGLVYSLLDDERSFIADEDGELPEYARGDQVDNAFIPLPGTGENNG